MYKNWRFEQLVISLMQALWRGYTVRKTATQAMKKVRERALSTIRNAVPDRILRTRSLAALTTLEKSCLGSLIWALMELGKSQFIEHYYTFIKISLWPVVS